MFHTIFTDLCYAKGMSPTATLKKLGISTSKLTAWKNGSLPSASILILLSEFFDVTIDFLLTGENKISSDNLTQNEMELLRLYSILSDSGKAWLKKRAEVLAELEKFPQEQDDRVIEQGKPETRYIEYSTLKVSAGTGQYLDTGLTEQLKIVKNDITADASFAVKITGDSMEPLYEDGEIVLVKSQPTVELGEVGIFIVGGLGYIKKLGKDRLISVNPNYDDILFHEWDEIYCKGLVVGVLEDDDIVD